MKRSLFARNIAATLLVCVPVWLGGALPAGHVHAAYASLNPANTLVIAEKEQPKSFDPLDTDDSTVNRMTVVAYDALLQYKAGTSTLIPGLATSYSIAPNGMSYTFTL